MGNLLSGILGAAGGFMTGGPGGAIIGAAGGLLTPSAPKNRTDKDAAAARANQQKLQAIAGLLQQRYQNASPGEQASLSYFFNRAGLGAGGNVPGGYGATIGGNPGVFGTPGIAGGHPGVGMGTAPGVNGGQPFAAYGSRRTLAGFTPAAAPNAQTGLVNGSQGIWNSPQYQLLRQQAEESIQHDMQGNQLGFNAALGARGIDRSSVQQGGQAAITAGANKSYSDFARALALSAADRQDQLVNQFNNALQPSLNSAGQAGSLYAGGAGLGQAGQQINQAQGNLQNSLLGQATQAAATYWGLGKNTGADPPITDASQIVGDISGYGPSTLQPGDFRAHGGPVQAGHEYVVGERGPEEFVPTGFDPYRAPMTFYQRGAFDNWMSMLVPPERQAFKARLDQWTKAYGLAGARQMLDSIIGKGGLNSDRDLEIARQLTLGAPEMVPPGRAQGGPIQGGQPYLVGENGPEIIQPSTDGYVIPNPNTPPADPLAGHSPLQLAALAHALMQKVN